MPNKFLLVLTQTVIVYFLVNIFRPKGLMAYFFPIICWSITALTILWVTGFEKIRLWFSEPVTITALLTATLHISASLFAGLLTKFGKSPYSFTPVAIIINIAYFSSALLALETSRTYLIKSCLKKRIFIGLGSISLFYTLISFSSIRYSALTYATPVKTAKFLGSEFLPALAQNLLATYLALLGGVTASIAYLGTLKAFEWLSPILPNPAWPIKTLISSLVPIVGFLTVNQTVSLLKLMRLGIISRSEVIGKKSKTQKSSIGWVIIAIIALIMIWSSTGLLGFQPSIIASGSMRPALDVGDIVITIQTPPNKIRVGDIIQYWREGEPAPTIHRVIEISQTEGATYIVTKGDANPAPDEPIITTRPLGKVVLIIPKLGWVSIYLKTAIASAWNFLVNNLTITYVTLGITSIGIAYGIHIYRNQPFRKLKRRLRR